MPRLTRNGVTQPLLVNWLAGGWRNQARGPVAQLRGLQPGLLAPLKHLLFIQL